jgi:hypothetical protein
VISPEPTAAPGPLTPPVASLPERSAQSWLLSRAGRWPHAQDHVLLSLVLLVSRGLLYLMGLRFKLVLDWMFLADPVELREHLLQSLLYFHAYPPGMNLLTGILLKLSTAHVAGLALCTFWIAGLVLFHSLLYLGRAFGLPRWVALALCIVFALIPPTLYLEQLYIYEYPATALLCLAAALFYRALRSPSSAAWGSFFLAFAILACFRSTFHLFWFAALVMGSLLIVGAPARRRVALGALAPAALLLGLYLKNYAVFGVFGATSWGGANLVAVTTRHMSPELRHSWVLEGKVSPFAEISVFAGPQKYTPFFVSAKSGVWPPLPLLDAFQGPSLGAANFNHWWFLEINKQRRKDSLYALQTRPLDYLNTVFHRSLVELFSPTTEWHPDDKAPTSPHAGHRRVLGGYERVYNRLVHGTPSPYGLYIFLPLFGGWAVAYARSRFKANEPEARAQAWLTCFFVLHVAYVLAVSCLFTAGECARYRYLIEPFIWVIVTKALVSLWGHARRRAAGFLSGGIPAMFGA